jgi:deoxyribodipyrimidine photolyase-related protein
MPLKKQYKTLRLILGDQLNYNHSWYKKSNDSTLYLIAELKQEATYTKHHIQKLCGFFLAMKNFSDNLKAQGLDVLYLDLNDTSNFPTLQDLLISTCKNYSIQNFQYQRPDEYRLLKQLKNIQLPQKITITEFDTEHFLLPFEEIEAHIKPQHHNLMENFYRKMRKRFNILVDKDKPSGGKWNYDVNNRKKIKASELNRIPQPLIFANNIRTIKERIDKHDIDYFGYIGETIIWPASRQQALELLDHFCQHCLPLFGHYQDAMTGQHPHKWTLYHSRLSFALNTKMLNPLEVITTAVNAYESRPSLIDLSQIEGFVRQILGWREYIRGIYWVNMPIYKDQNHLNAHGTLPEYFWTADTKMSCMKHAIQQSLTYAYAHHIQRLMVTGNFCLLTGVHPDEVDAWYLGVYIDAIEWVEMPNTRGMSQFADGGWLATKPYCSSGNYINKMSDYCKNCHYDVKAKTSDNACPFNSLYWGFMDKHRQDLERNPRIGMIYRNWDKQNQENKTEILNKASWCIENLEDL